MTWYHLLLDLYGCAENSLNNEDLLKEIFSKLSKLMGLQIIAGPVIVRYVGEEGSPSGEGLSGFMIVAESHVSIHTDIRTSYASIDVYSCKEFDQEAVISYLLEVFKPRKIEKKFIPRGALKIEADQLPLGE